MSTDPYKRQLPRIGPNDKEFYPPVKRLWSLLDGVFTETDSLRRYRMIWEIFKFHATQGPYVMGTIANYPQIILVRQGLRNVPRRDQLPLHGYTNPWIIPEPATYDPEGYYWDDPAEHSR